MGAPAIVFDLDGTLIDSAPDLCLAVNAVLRDHGRPAVDVAEVREMIGHGARKLIERAFQRTGAPATRPELDQMYADFLRHYDDVLVVHTRFYDGVPDTLTVLAERGHPLAICTNKPTAPALRIAERMGLDRWFAVVVGGDDAPKKKPDPRLVHEALRRLGVPAAGAWMVGDSTADVGAARAAGVGAIAVSYGYNHGDALDADVVIDRFEALLEVL